jgi:hypothetical protein
LFSLWVKKAAGGIAEVPEGSYRASPGDWFQFKLSFPSPVWFRVFYLPSDGGVEFLGPYQGTLTASEFSYPGRGRWFSIRGESGSDQLVFVTSNRVDPQLDALLVPERRDQLFDYLKQLQQRNSNLADSGRSIPTVMDAPVRGSAGTQIPVPEGDVGIQSFFLVH